MLNDLRFRVRALFRHQEVEEELDEELRFHFDREVQKYIGRASLQKKRGVWRGHHLAATSR